MLSVTMSTDGWSIITPDSGVLSRQIFVSATGNDGNSGLSPTSPVASLDKAKTLLRNNSADQLLLKAGDTFIDTFSFLNVGGFDAQNPLVISSYTYDGTTVRTGVEATGLGAARPKIVTRNTDGSTASGIGTSGTGAPDNIAIVGLEFTPFGYTGHGQKFGLSLLGADDNVLIEDNYIHGYFQNIVLGAPDSPVTNAFVRRNVITDAYNLDGYHPQGLYASGSTDGLKIYENVFDHNGWRNVRRDPITNAVIDGAEHPEDKTMFRHQMYINTGAKNVDVEYNIATRAPLRGTLLRAGGKVKYNLYALDGVGAQVGHTDSEVVGNVILQGQDLPSLPAGNAIDSFEVPNLLIDNNIIAHDESAYTSNVVGINVGYGVDHATVTNNIVFDWRNAFKNYGNSATVTDNKFEVFDDHHPIITQDQDPSASFLYQNNKYYTLRSIPFKIGDHFKSLAEWQAATGLNGGTVDNSTYGSFGFLDPYRTLAGYNVTVPVASGNPPRSATFEDYMNSARQQSKSNWNNAYTAAPAINYIREGFGVGNITAPPVGTGVGGNGTTIKVTLPQPVAAERTSHTNGAPLPGTVRFSRGGPQATPLTVYFTVDGTATSRRDYTLFNAPNYVTIPANATFIDVAINPITDNDFTEVSETIVFHLTTDPTGVSQYNVGTPSTATAVIKDWGDDPDTVTPDPGGGSTGGGGTGGGGGVVDQPDPHGLGLRGSYYNNPDLTSLVTQKTDPTVNFNWGTGAPTAGVDPTTYSVRWEGQIQPQFANEYTFNVTAADGVRLMIKDPASTTWTTVIDRFTEKRLPGDANGERLGELGRLRHYGRQLRRDRQSSCHRRFQW